MFLEGSGPVLASNQGLQSNFDIGEGGGGGGGGRGGALFSYSILGGTRHFFSLTLYNNLKNIMGGGEGACAPPGPPPLLSLVMILKINLSPIEHLSPLPL